VFIYASLVPTDTKIGLRINTTSDLGFATIVSYGDKFGFPVAQFTQALQEAKDNGLIVDRLYFHAGWNIPAHGLEVFEKALSVALACALVVGPSLTVVDVGGGLEVLHHASHAPSLGVDAWARAIEKCLMGPLMKVNKKARIVCEPGTGIVANAGLLVAEVNTVEQRTSAIWVGINAGYNINCYKSTYGLLLSVLVVNEIPPTEEEDWKTYQIAGNINEGIDIFAVDLRLPPLQDGDLLGFFPLWRVWVCHDEQSLHARAGPERNPSVLAG